MIQFVYRFKFNISITELCQAVIKALLELSIKDGISKVEQIKEFDKVRTKKVFWVIFFFVIVQDFQFFSPVLMFIINSDQQSSTSVVNEVFQYGRNTTIRCALNRGTHYYSNKCVLLFQYSFIFSCIFGSICFEFTCLHMAHNRGIKLKARSE